MEALYDERETMAQSRGLEHRPQGISAQRFE